MKTTAGNKIRNILVIAMTGLSLYAAQARAELSGDIRIKAENYTKQLVSWAKTSVVVDAVKSGNTKGAVPGMTNSKWEGLGDGDSAVVSLQTNQAAMTLAKWEAERGFDKLFARDTEGNVVAFSKKPLLYNNANRKPFNMPLKGKPWIDEQVATDPTTQHKTVQIGVPVMDDNKVIGVLHGSIKVD